MSPGKATRRRRSSLKFRSTLNDVALYQVAAIRSVVDAAFCNPRPSLVDDDLLAEAYPEPGERRRVLACAEGLAAFLEEFLSERRGRKVEIHTPQRGQKRAMIELVESNAKHSFDQRFRVLTPSSKAIQEALQSLQGVAGARPVRQRSEQRTATSRYIERRIAKDFPGT